jgi:predicted PurR-regulated permease PerM
MLPPQNSSGIRLAGILAGVVAVMYFAREVLIPLAFAVTLTLLLSPAVSWLQKLHMRRVAAALLVILLTIAVAGGVGYIIFDQLVQVVNDLPAYRENIHHKLDAIRTPSKGALGRAAQSVKELGKELATPPEPAPTPSLPARGGGRSTTPAGPVPVQIVEPSPNTLAYLRDLLMPVIGPLAAFGIVLVFTLFLLVEEADLRNRLFRLGGSSRVNLLTQAMDDATRRVSRYLMLQFLVNATFGTLCGIGLFLIGVPYAALWGAVGALLRIVPYVGSVVAGLMPLALSLAVFDGWRSPLMVFLLFTTLELITGNLIEPWLYGSHTGISSLALLLSTVFWAILWGPAGLILSTPLTVCVVVLGRHVPHLAFLHILLGDEQALSPDAHLYQRLLAMDEQDARTVVDQYLSQNSLLQLYDVVILPALGMAEHDRHKGSLDQNREEFLFLSLREMLAELSEKSQNPTFGPATDPATGPATNPATAPATELRPAPKPGRVLCFAAHDDADEIAAAMLAQLLEQAGFATIAFPVDSAAQSLLGLIEPAANDICCISSVPPFAFSHAKTVSRQLRKKFPQAKILVGVWGFTGDLERGLQRFQPAPPDKLVSTLAEALTYLGVPPAISPASSGPNASNAKETVPPPSAVPGVVGVSPPKVGIVAAKRSLPAQG